MATATTTKKVTLDDLIQYLAESRKLLDEEMAARVREREADMAAWEAKLDKSMEKFTNSEVEIVEHLITPNVFKKFSDFGFTFTETTRNHVLTDGHGHTLAEIDAEFHNGQDIMVVEVKAHPGTDDVGRLIKNMTLLRDMNKFPGKNLYGSLAGAVVSDLVRDEAIKAGFFVLCQSGDTMQIMPDDKSFKPKRW
jgi:hypothetical protein